jgi:hypothetical protein
MKRKDWRKSAFGCCQGIDAHTGTGRGQLGGKKMPNPPHPFKRRLSVFFIAFLD